MCSWVQMLALNLMSICFKIFPIADLDFMLNSVSHAVWNTNLLVRLLHKSSKLGGYSTVKLQILERPP